MTLSPLVKNFQILAKSPKEVLTMLDRSKANLRDQLIQQNSQHYDPTYIGGIRRFRELNPRVIDELINLNVLDPNDAQNDAPPIREFYNYAMTHLDTKITFNGYTVTPNRDDYRVSIDRINFKPNDPVIKSTIYEINRLGQPSEGSIQDGYFWWD